MYAFGRRETAGVGRAEQLLSGAALAPSGAASTSILDKGHTSAWPAVSLGRMLVLKVSETEELVRLLNAVLHVAEYDILPKRAVQAESPSDIVQQPLVHHGTARADSTLISADTRQLTANG